jgi:hypothetical protein
MRSFAFVYFARGGAPVHAFFDDNVAGESGDWDAVKRAAIAAQPKAPFAWVDCIFRGDGPVGRTYFSRFTAEHIARVERAEFMGPLL